MASVQRRGALIVPAAALCLFVLALLAPALPHAHAQPLDSVLQCEALSNLQGTTAATPSPVAVVSMPGAATIATLGTFAGTSSSGYFRLTSDPGSANWTAMPIPSGTTTFAAAVAMADGLTIAAASSAVNAPRFLQFDSNGSTTAASWVTPTACSGTVSTLASVPPDSVLISLSGPQTCPSGSGTSAYHHLFNKTTGTYTSLPTGFNYLAISLAYHAVHGLLVAPGPGAATGTGNYLKKRALGATSWTNAKYLVVASGTLTDISGVSSSVHAFGSSGLSSDPWLYFAGNALGSDSYGNAFGGASPPVYRLARWNGTILERCGLVTGGSGSAIIKSIVVHPITGIVFFGGSGNLKCEGVNCAGIGRWDPTTGLSSPLVTSVALPSLTPTSGFIASLAFAPAPSLYEGGLTGLALYFGGTISAAFGFSTNSIGRCVWLSSASSVTATPSVSPSGAATPSLSPQASPSVTAAAFPSVSAEASPSVTAAASPSVSAEASPSVTAAASPSVSAEASPSVTAAASPSVSAEASPSVTAAASPSVSAETSPSATAAASPSVSAEASPSASSSGSASASPSVSPSASRSVSASVAASPSLSVSVSPRLLTITSTRTGTGSHLPTTAAVVKSVEVQLSINGISPELMVLPAVATAFQSVIADIVSTNTAVSQTRVVITQPSSSPIPLPGAATLVATVSPSPLHVRRLSNPAQPCGSTNATAASHSSVNLLLFAGTQTNLFYPGVFQGAPPAVRAAIAASGADLTTLAGQQLAMGIAVSMRFRVLLATCNSTVAVGAFCHLVATCTGSPHSMQVKGISVAVSAVTAPSPSPAATAPSSTVWAGWLIAVVAGVIALVVAVALVILWRKPREGGYRYRASVQPEIQEPGLQQDAA